MKTHKDLDVWKLSLELVTMIYQTTQDYPKSELFGLVSQMRRAAVSIPSNIAEGAARLHTKEFVQFLHVALGSASELETQLIISERLGYCEQEIVARLNSGISQIIRMIKSITNSIQKSCVPK